MPGSTAARSVAPTTSGCTFTSTTDAAIVVRATESFQDQKYYGRAMIRVARLAIIGATAAKTWIQFVLPFGSISGITTRLPGNGLGDGLRRPFVSRFPLG